MGAYIYKLNPSDVMTANVQFKDGTVKQLEVGRYTYAYKPYWSYEERNRELYRRRVSPSKAAWARSGRDRPQYGVLEDNPHVFTTPGGRLTVNDEAIGQSDYGPKYIGKIVP